MFEFGREVRRFFGAAEPFAAFQDGLTGGDPALLELLDLRLLHVEAEAADVAAGRIGAKDRAARMLAAAGAWREIARRSGDSAALRKAAQIAEAAARHFESERRHGGLALAHCEQARCAMLGAELFGDDGLNAAAEATLGHLGKNSGLAGAFAAVLEASLAGRRALAGGDSADALVTADAFEAPLAVLAAAGRKTSLWKLIAAEHRAVQGDILAGCGARLHDRALIGRALETLKLAVAGLDPAYEPLTWSRAESLRGATMVLAGETEGEVALISDGVGVLADALEPLTRDHSPLDWARAQAALAAGLQSLGEATGSERAFEQAVTGFDRAGQILKDMPALALRAQVANARAACMVRSVEITGDLAVLDAAEIAFKTELTSANPQVDPVAWAVAQLNLARVYEARLQILRRDRGERAAAAVALAAAFDVFAEHGLRSLTELAGQGLERLRAAHSV